MRVRNLGKLSGLVGLTLALAIVLFISSTNCAWAQVAASISGRVDDSSGAGVPDVTVTVTSQESGATRNVTTDEQGEYRVLSLRVGQYEVKAEKQGFKTAIQSGVSLVVGQQQVVTLRMELGAVEQQITVTGAVPLVNTTTTSVAGLVGEEQVKDLPLNGRSFDNLLALNAGSINTSVSSTRGSSSAAVGNLFSVSGRRSHENLFLLNGVEYTGPNLTHALPGGVSGQLLGIDAIREFNVMTDTYSAEYGKRAGAQISAVTMSGTNNFHGTLFEFLRNSVLDAKNYFDHPLGERIPPFKRNQFGGAIGGPIQKDKTFVFFNYEGFRQRLGVSDVNVVPDSDARLGLLPNAAGVEAPVPNLNPSMLPYMAFWPLPNGPELTGGTALAYSNPLQSIREDFATVRIDRTISNHDSMSAVYTFDDGYNVSPGEQTNALFASTGRLRNQLLSLGETHIFSANMINNFTFGATRVGWFFNSPPIGPFPASLSFVEGQLPGYINIGGATAGTSFAISSAGSALTTYFGNGKTQFSVGDGLQIIKGRHQISLGVWLQHLNSNELGNLRSSGTATFASLQSFLQGTVGTFLVARNPHPYGWRQLEGAWYLQDAIQLRPNLTVRVGLRHDFTNGWNEANGRAANYILDSNGVIETNPMHGNSEFTQNNAKWLFGPRVGLAWDPLGKGKTSISAAFGTYYDIQDSLGWILASIPPQGNLTYTNVQLSSLVPITPATPIPPTCGPGVPQPCALYGPAGVQQNLNTPTVEEWRLTVEQQVTANMSFSASYVGSHAYHELASVDLNSIHPQMCSNPAGCVGGGIGKARGTVPEGTQYIPVGTRPNPYIANSYLWFSVGYSNYNALELELKRRFRKGLQFRTNYTWSKALNTSSQITGGDATNEPMMLMDPYQPSRDYGAAAYDVKDQFTFSTSYELPFGHGKSWLSGASGAADKLASGWQLNSIVTVLSGFPFTPTIGSNWSGNGDSRAPDRPSLNPAFTGPVITGNPNQWFNPQAFILPVAGTWGNSGRGQLRAPGLATWDQCCPN